MPKSEYQTCMTAKMKSFPKGISKEERGKLFCSSAKICSGKAKTEAEALLICSQPKPAKAKKSGKKNKQKSCDVISMELAECVVTKLSENKVYKSQVDNVNTVGTAIANALIECQCDEN